MAETVLCDNCGAPLAPEDGFCGECGAPRPTLTPGVSPARPETPSYAVEATAGPAPLPMPPSPSRARSEGGRTAAKVIAILSGVVSVGLCGMGLILALITPVQDATKQDMLLTSTLCCFSPGILVLILAVILWVVAVRRK